MTEQEYLEISRLLRGGMSLNQAAGTNAKRVQYQRMKAKKDRMAYKENKIPGLKSSFSYPGQEAQEDEEQEIFSDEDLESAFPGFLKKPKIVQGIIRASVRMALHPEKGPDFARVHLKVITALCKEFREKEDRRSFTPEEYAQAINKLSSGRTQIETYEEHYAKTV